MQIMFQFFFHCDLPFGGGGVAQTFVVQNFDADQFPPCIVLCGYSTLYPRAHPSVAGGHHILLQTLFMMQLLSHTSTNNQTSHVEIFNSKFFINKYWYQQSQQNPKLQLGQLLIPRLFAGILACEAVLQLQAGLAGRFNYE